MFTNLFDDVTLCYIVPVFFFFFRTDDFPTHITTLFDTKVSQDDFIGSS